MMVRAAQVAIRPTHPGDLDLLDRIDLAADRSVGFRYRGSMPSASERRSRMWQGVLCQHLITSVPDGDPVGYATAYGADLRSGHAWVALAVVPEMQRRGLGLFGFGLFVTLLFREWPLRALYAESAADNVAQFRSALDDGTAVVEAEFRDALLRPDGSESDLFWLAIVRETWEERWGRLVRRRLLLAEQAGMETGWPG
ncbi:MAG: hypothetical protein R2716_13255 [Microthrixaceae bacterium]